MKHFIGYRADGGLASVEVHHGGWPDCGCSVENCGGLADPRCTNDVVKSVRASQAKYAPDVIGWVAVVCPCPSELGTCACVSKALALNRVSADGTLVPKADPVVLLDGVEIGNEALVSSPPGSVRKLKVVAAAPEGSVLTCATRGEFDICEEPQTFNLVFSGGETRELTLVTPAQGGKGVLGFGSPFVKGWRFTLRGWAT